MCQTSWQARPARGSEAWCKGYRWLSCGWRGGGEKDSGVIVRGGTRAAQFSGARLRGDPQCGFIVGKFLADPQWAWSQGLTHKTEGGISEEDQKHDHTLGPNACMQARTHTHKRLRARTQTDIDTETDIDTDTDSHTYKHLALPHHKEWKQSLRKLLRG